MAIDFTALFPEEPQPNHGPGMSYCVAPNARMFDYELLTPGECRLRGCLRAVDQEDAKRILLNRHPGATQIIIGKGRRISSPSAKT